MNSVLPESSGYVIIGAGVHGLSTAWHLAMELEASGRGNGKDIVVVDKTGPGAGATGINVGAGSIIQQQRGLTDHEITQFLLCARLANQNGGGGTGTFGNHANPNGGRPSAP